MGYDVPMRKNNPASDTGFDNIYPIELHKIPILGAVACGEPILMSEERENYIMSGTDIKADFCLVAKGDSMMNARIMDGDIVFIRRQPEVENGEIKHIIFENVIGMEMITADLWGKSPHVFDFYSEKFHKRQLIPKIFRKMHELKNHGEFSRLTVPEDYIELVIVGTSGDQFRIACEYLLWE